MGFALRPMTYIAIVFHPDFNDFYGIQLVVWALNPVRNWLVIPTIFVPLFHQGAYLIWPDITLACRVHICVRQMFLLLFFVFLSLMYIVPFGTMKAC